MTDSDLSRYDLQRLSVLLVDDEPNMCRLLTELLRALGVLSIRVAGDGVEGLEVLREFQPDIVIADWRMSPMDGLEFVREVRKLEERLNPFMPVMMLTGHTEEWLVRQARDSGINIFLAKPVSGWTLATHVIKLIEDPRPFVRAPSYAGPDRRWKDEPPPVGAGERRKQAGCVRWKRELPQVQSPASAPWPPEPGEVEIFRPPARKLRAKVVSGAADAPAISAAAVRRMDLTLDRLQDDYRNWLAEDLDRLRELLGVLRADAGCAEDLLQDIAATAIHLKSLSATFDRTMVGAIASSLAHFAMMCRNPVPLDLAVIETHIVTLATALRHNIAGDGGAVGKDVVETLRMLIAKANQRHAA